jgi:uncharacterized membrane protein YbhN (UPF0104 family)
VAVSDTRITGRAAQAATGIVVSTVFAWLAVRNVRLDQVTTALSHARWRWLVPATALLLLSVAFRAVRWSVMFPTRRRPAPGACFWAINIGYLANALLPFRAGELIRVMALSKDTGTPTGQGLVTILLERLFDLFTVAVLTLAIAPMIPASWARTWLVALSLLTVAVAVACVGLARSDALQRLASRLIAKVPPLERRRQTLRTAAAALEPLRSARAAGTVLAWSFAAWLVLLASTLMVERAVVHGLAWPSGALALVGTTVRPGDPVLRCKHRGVRGRRSPGALHIRGGLGRRARVCAGLPRRLDPAPSAARRGRRRAHGRPLAAGFAPGGCHDRDETVARGVGGDPLPRRAAYDRGRSRGGVARHHAGRRRRGGGGGRQRIDRRLSAARRGGRRAGHP